jgi:hypothetical protein
VLSQHRIPVIGRGSGTNLCGGTVPVQGGVIMVMHRMNAILEVDMLNLTATVQPDIITKQFICFRVLCDNVFKVKFIRTPSLKLPAPRIFSG